MNRSNSFFVSSPFLSYLRIVRGDRINEQRIYVELFRYLLIKNDIAVYVRSPLSVFFSLYLVVPIVVH